MKVSDNEILTENLPGCMSDPLTDDAVAYKCDLPAIR